MTYALLHFITLYSLSRFPKIIFMSIIFTCFLIFLTILTRNLCTFLPYRVDQPTRATWRQQLVLFPRIYCFRLTVRPRTEIILLPTYLKVSICLRTKDIRLTCVTRKYQLHHSSVCQTPKDPSKSVLASYWILNVLIISLRLCHPLIFSQGKSSNRDSRYIV